MAESMCIKDPSDFRIIIRFPIRWKRHDGPDFSRRLVFILAKLKHDSEMVRAKLCKEPWGRSTLVDFLAYFSSYIC
jgi:hypothetical protein